MAFNPKEMAGVCAGSVYTPSVFTYRTEDSIANITTDGYFNGLCGGIEVNDVIYAVVLTGGTAVLSIIVCVKAEYVDGVGFSTDFSVLSSFAGDVRGDDTAGFIHENLGGNIGAGSTSKVYSEVARFFTYRNNTDSVGDKVAEYYFADMHGLLLNDIIFAVGADGASFLRMEESTDGTITTAHGIAFA